MLTSKNQFHYYPHSWLPLPSIITTPAIERNIECLNQSNSMRPSIEGCQRRVSPSIRPLNTPSVTSTHVKKPAMEDQGTHICERVHLRSSSSVFWHMIMDFEGVTVSLKVSLGIET